MRAARGSWHLRRRYCRLSSARLSVASVERNQTHVSRGQWKIHVINIHETFAGIEILKLRIYRTLLLLSWKITKLFWIFFRSNIDSRHDLENGWNIQAHFQNVTHNCLLLINEFKKEDASDQVRGIFITKYHLKVVVCHLYQKFIET